MIKALLTAIAEFFRYKAENEKQKSLYGIHDRFQIQKNRVKALRQELNDSVASGTDANALRLLENELKTESSYLRTLENHLTRRAELHSRGGDIEA